MLQTCSLLFFAIAIVGNGGALESYKIPIGVILSPEYESYQRQLQVQFANRHKSNVFTFELILEHVDWPDSYHVVQAINRLIDKKVVTIITPTTEGAFTNVISFSNNAQIPFVNLGERTLNPKEVAMFGFHMKPDIFPVVIDTMNHQQWKNYHFFYEKQDEEKSSQLLMKILERFKGETSSSQRVEKAGEVVELLRKIGPSRTNVLLKLHPQMMNDVFTKFTQLPDVSLQTYDFILADIGDEDFLMKINPPVNVTIFSYVKGKKLLPRSSLVKSLLIIDAASILQKVFSDILSSNPDELQNVLSQNWTSVFPHGPLIAQKIRKIQTTGFQTGEMHFDVNGCRANYSLQVTQITTNSLFKHFTWSDKNGLVPAGSSVKYLLSDSPSPKIGSASVDVPLSSPDSQSLQNKYFVVTSILNDPFLMKKNSSATGFEGFVVDMLESMSKSLGFKYEIHLSHDNRYGTVDSNGKWNGMIGEVLYGEADIALADITITSTRSEVVTMSPFMKVGIGMLLKQPTFLSSNGDAASSGYLFLKVFSTDAWICIVAAYVGVSLIICLVVKLTQHRHRNRHTLSIAKNSFWYPFNILFFSTSGVYPRSVSSRFIAAIWCIFCLFLMVMYISCMTRNMAETWTAEPKPLETDIFKIIQESLRTGKPEIGSISGGSTSAFLQDSKVEMYQRLYKRMKESENSFVRSGSDGVKRVKDGNGDYAFLTESTQVQHYTNKYCDMYGTVNRLDSKAYGIVTRKEWKYSGLINAAVLMMEEEGVMPRLQKKWWRSNCLQGVDGEVAVTAPKKMPLYRILKLHDLRGLFYLLIIGVLLGLIVTAIEVYVFRLKTSKMQNDHRGEFRQAEEREAEIDMMHCVL